MKIRLLSACLLLSVVTVVSTACNQSNKTATSQTAQVTTGNLTVTVSGSGTIEVTHESDLTFGSAGRIATLLVKEGDSVKQGEVIAKLETDALELSLAQAKVAYSQAQLSVNQSALAVVQAGVAVSQAQINVQSAQIALTQTINTSTVSDIRIAQANVDTAQRDVKDSLQTLTLYIPGSIGYNEYQKTVLQAQARLKAAQDVLDAMLGGFSNSDIALKQQQVTAAQQALAAAQQSLSLAQLSATVGKQSIDLSRLSLDYAQRQLDKTTLTAPFTGTIDKVPAHEGDTVLPSSLIAHLVEPGKLDLKVQVDEIDIPSVKVGQRAIVKVDALQDIRLDGKVISINPIPVNDAGVTLYFVKIGLNSTDLAELRGGMSASADIVITERDNVLLVPDRAIKQNSQGNPAVNVVVNGQTQSKAVVTGISDGFQTEIVSGLKAGETVISQ